MLELQLLPRTERRMAVAGAGLCLGLIAFGELGASATKGFSWDSRLLGFSSKPGGGTLESAMNAVAWGTMLVGGVVAACVLILLLRRRQVREIFFWVLGLAGLVILDLTLKPLFHRMPLSHVGGGYSFPSGNAIATMGGVAALVLLFAGQAVWRRTILVLGYAAVALNGVAIVYLRWHYPSDVLAGWCVAAAWIYGLWLLVSPPRVRRSERTLS
jgi:membrane-associated phospholipid phosphatase